MDLIAILVTYLDTTTQPADLFKRAGHHARSLAGAGVDLGALDSAAGQLLETRANSRALQTRSIDGSPQAFFWYADDYGTGRDWLEELAEMHSQPQISTVLQLWESALGIHIDWLEG